MDIIQGLKRWASFRDLEMGIIGLTRWAFRDLEMDIIHGLTRWKSYRDLEMGIQGLRDGHHSWT